MGVSTLRGPTRIARQDNGVFAGMFGAHVVRTAFQPIFAFARDRLALIAYEGLARPFRETEQIAPQSFFASVPPHHRLKVETMTRSLHLLNAGACLAGHVSVFINLDPSLFGEAGTAESALRDMRAVLRRAAIDPRRVVCEVTEQKTASEAALVRFVQALRRNGFRIAVDDYGSASSDINRIKELKPDIVKFDAKWITRLMETGPGFALLAAMVSSFGDQGIETVFEGIEEGWQLELAEKAGASMAQGFVLARPEIVPAVFAAVDLARFPGSPPIPQAASTVPETGTA